MTTPRSQSGAWRRLMLPCALVAALTATLTAGLPALFADTPDNTIFACANSDGTLTLRPAGGCLKDTTELSWNITGPQGATGPAATPLPGPPGSDASVTTGSVMSALIPRRVSGISLTDMPIEDAMVYIMMLVDGDSREDLTAILSNMETSRKQHDELRTAQAAAIAAQDTSKAALKTAYETGVIPTLRRPDPCAHPVPLGIVQLTCERFRHLDAKARNAYLAGAGFTLSGLRIPALGDDPATSQLVDRQHTLDRNAAFIAASKAVGLP